MLDPSYLQARKQKTYFIVNQVLTLNGKRTDSFEIGNIQPRPNYKESNHEWGSPFLLISHGRTRFSVQLTHLA